MWSFLSTFFVGGLDEKQKDLLWKWGVTFLLSIHIAWACGLVPLAGSSVGFATVSTVAALEVSVNDIREKQLLDAIERERRNVCIHLKDRNNAAAQYARRQRDTFVEQYTLLTGHGPQPASCEELGIRLTTTD